MSSICRIRFLAFAVAALSTATPGQTTFQVPSAQYPSIQSAIDVSMDGDTVQVAAGIYFENINFRGHAITVVGQGPGLSMC